MYKKVISGGVMLSIFKEKDLSYKEMFNSTFGVFLRLIKPISLFAMIMFIPMESLFYFTGFDNIMINFVLGHSPLSPYTIALVCGVTAVMYVIVFPLLTAGLMGILYNTTDEKPGALKDALTGAFSRIHKIIPTMLIYYIPVLLGMVLIFPGIYYLIIYAFSLQAMVVTGRWGLGALRESFFIMRGRFLKTAGFLLITFMFYQASNFIVSQVLGAVLSFVPPNDILNLIIDFAFWIFQCYFIMVTCVWYINKRNITPNNIDMRL
jgi:hypothetical protein